VKSLPVQCIRSGPDLAEVRAPEQAQESASRLVLVIDIDIDIEPSPSCSLSKGAMPSVLSSSTLYLSISPPALPLAL
jgi:hypothetical protein